MLTQQCGNRGVWLVPKPGLRASGHCVTPAVPAAEEHWVLGWFAEPVLGELQGREKCTSWLKGWCSCVCQVLP